MSEPGDTEDRAPWLPLRFRDVDAFGHVYHAEFLTLLDEGRSRFFGDALELDSPSDYLLARVEIDYVSSILLADREVRATFAVERVGTTSLTLAEALHVRGGRVVSRGRSVVVLRDADSGATRALTGRERAAAERLLARPDPEASP